MNLLIHAKKVIQVASNSLVSIKKEMISQMFIDQFLPYVQRKLSKLQQKQTSLFRNCKIIQTHQLTNNLENCGDHNLENNKSLNVIQIQGEVIQCELYSNQQNITRLVTLLVLKYFQINSLKNNIQKYHPKSVLQFLFQQIKLKKFQNCKHPDEIKDIKIDDLECIKKYCPKTILVIKLSTFVNQYLRGYRQSICQDQNYFIIFDNLLKFSNDSFKNYPNVQIFKIVYENISRSEFHYFIRVNNQKFVLQNAYEKSLQLLLYTYSNLNFDQVDFVNSNLKHLIFHFSHYYIDQTLYQNKTTQEIQQILLQKYYVSTYQCQGLYFKTTFLFNQYKQAYQNLFNDRPIVFNQEQQQLPIKAFLNDFTQSKLFYSPYSYFIQPNQFSPSTSLFNLLQGMIADPEIPLQFHLYKNNIDIKKLYFYLALVQTQKKYKKNNKLSNNHILANIIKVGLDQMFRIQQQEKLKLQYFDKRKVSYNNYIKLKEFNDQFRLNYSIHQFKQIFDIFNQNRKQETNNKYFQIQMSTSPFQQQQIQNIINENTQNNISNFITIINDNSKQQIQFQMQLQNRLIKIQQAEIFSVDSLFKVEQSIFYVKQEDFLSYIKSYFLKDLRNFLRTKESHLDWWIQNFFQIFKFFEITYDNKLLKYFCQDIQIMGQQQLDQNCSIQQRFQTFCNSLQYQNAQRLKNDSAFYELSLSYYPNLKISHVIKERKITEDKIKLELNSDYFMLCSQEQISPEQEFKLLGSFIKEGKINLNSDIVGRIQKELERFFLDKQPFKNLIKKINDVIQNHVTWIGDLNKGDKINQEIFNLKFSELKKQQVEMITQKDIDLIMLIVNHCQLLIQNFDEILIMIGFSLSEEGTNFLEEVTCFMLWQCLYKKFDERLHNQEKEQENILKQFDKFILYHQKINLKDQSKIQAESLMHQIFI